MKKLPIHLFILASAFLLAANALAQDYKLEPVAAAPDGLPAAYASQIAPQGYRLTGPQGAWCEVWWRKSIPTVTKPADDAIVFPIAQGTWLGILRFPGKAADRRGQTIQPGLYTLRYSNYPVDGAHQGVAPQRDFALMTPVANDPDPTAMPAFDALVKQSQKASGTPHPAVLSLEPPAQGNALPSVTKEGDTPDWVLNVKIGDLPLAIILIGKAAG